jgi:hypothetical protein
MRNVFLCFLTTALALAATAADDITGDYTGFGREPYNGAMYTCETNITQDGEVYKIVWDFGTYSYDGVGIIKDGRLCVGYASQLGYGVAIYNIEADGVLDGAIGLPGYKEIGTEKLHKN